MIYLVWACFQVEGESEDQASTDQTSAAKTKSIFIAQNVASLQELGENHPFSVGGKKCKSHVSPVLHLTALNGRKLFFRTLLHADVAQGGCGCNVVFFIAEQMGSVYL